MSWKEALQAKVSSQYSSEKFIPDEWIKLYSEYGKTRDTRTRVMQKIILQGTLEACQNYKVCFFFCFFFDFLTPIPHIHQHFFFKKKYSTLYQIVS